MSNLPLYDREILAIGAVHENHAAQTAEVLEVDRVAILGAILEEAHDSTEPGSWKRKVVDALPNYRSNSHEEVLSNFNYIDSLTPVERYEMGNFTKLKNPVMLGRGDGYFKPYTAIKLLEEYNREY